ncbi:MAG: amino acid ABC transporter permease [Spirochaetaceae bacterium]|jgi:L-cystine transport system permease protein|nr:amino acid ABC transporter permease [Spirochaetaceae bacterium]
MPNFFTWKNVIYFLPRVVSALPTTLLIVLVATLSGLAVGLILAFPRLEKIPVLSHVCQVLVSFIRGTPILIQMFIVYYALPMLLLQVGINITRWDKIYFIYITYGINTGAYFSEIIRSSILSVPRSQRDAAAAVGLTRAQTYRRIIIPQSVAIAIPSLGTSMTSLLQDTSLAFALGILDVIGRVRALGAITSRILEGYVVAALIFIVLTVSLEKLFGYIETKTRHQAPITAR